MLSDVPINKPSLKVILSLRKIAVMPMLPMCFTTLHVDQEDRAEILFCREKDTVLAAEQGNAVESG
jgi:hypothetical protein